MYSIVTTAIPRFPLTRILGQIVHILPVMSFFPEKKNKQHLHCTEFLFFLTVLIKAQSTSCAMSQLSYSHFCFGGFRYFERTYMNTEYRSIIKCYFFLLQIFCGSDKFQIKAHFSFTMGKSNETIIY